MSKIWYQVIPNILDIVKKLNPKSILDIGVGFGKYGVLFRDLLEIPHERYAKENWQIKVDGVEACKACHNPIYDFAYNNVYYDNILTLIDTLPSYDCIILINVMEYFTKEDGLRLIEKLVDHCNKSVIVSTPFYQNRQNNQLENKFEQNESVWSLVDFEKFNFIYERVAIEDNSAHIFTFKKCADYKKMSFEKLTCSTGKPKNPLHITYFLPHKNLTGGMKMLLQQMKYLKERGHKIIACMRASDESKSALPDWFELAIDEEVIVPAGESILKHIPICDVIVAGWITQLIELEDSEIPVLYWEQGNEWLFGDIKDSKQVDSVLMILEKCYQTKHVILSVSPYVANNIFARYGRKTSILSNGIDIEFYCVGEKSNNNKILLVGHPGLPFKGFDSAFRALSLAWNAGYRFQVDWVCQTKISIPEAPFYINPIVQPTQEELVKCYQCADLLLFTSWYEGFGMPPLEAMSCGTAVVCTQCGGINSFVKNEYNALTSEAGDIISLTANIVALLKYPQLRYGLSINGRKTAERLSYSEIISGLEDYLYSTIEGIV